MDGTVSISDLTTSTSATSGELTEDGVSNTQVPPKQAAESNFFPDIATVEAKDDDSISKDISCRACQVSSLIPGFTPSSYQTGSTDDDNLRTINLSTPTKAEPKVPPPKKEANPCKACQSPLSLIFDKPPAPAPPRPAEVEKEKGSCKVCSSPPPLTEDSPSGSNSDGASSQPFGTKFFEATKNFLDCLCTDKKSKVVGSVTGDKSDRSCRVCRSAQSAVNVSELSDDKRKPAEKTKCIGDDHVPCDSPAKPSSKLALKKEVPPTCPCKGRRSVISMKLPEIVSSEDLLLEQRKSSKKPYCKRDDSYTALFEERTKKLTGEPAPPPDRSSPVCRPCSTRGQSDSSVSSSSRPKSPVDDICRPRSSPIEKPIPRQSQMDASVCCNILQTKCPERASRQSSTDAPALEVRAFKTASEGTTTDEVAAEAEVGGGAGILSIQTLLKASWCLVFVGGVLATFWRVMSTRPPSS